MLKYIGTSFILGVPARDLTADEVKLYRKTILLKSKLYRAFTKAELAEMKAREKAQSAEVEDGR
jgi:hypothetical protein